MKITDNPDNQWTSIRIVDKQWTRSKANGNHAKTQTIKESNEHQLNPCKSLTKNDNKWKSNNITKINETPRSHEKQNKRNEHLHKRKHTYTTNVKYKNQRTMKSQQNTWKNENNHGN